jgi:hypothetical protein
VVEDPLTPEERVRSFMAAMTEWEPRAHKALLEGDKAGREALKEQLRKIYDEHLSAKGKGAGRFGKNLVGPGPALQDPPKFDQDVSRTEGGAKKSIFYVITKPRRDPNTLWRFTVTVDASGTPLIDDLQGVALTPAGEPHGEWGKFGY